jgi:hypothetical protein
VDFWAICNSERVSSLQGAINPLLVASPIPGLQKISCHCIMSCYIWLTDKSQVILIELEDLGSLLTGVSSSVSCYAPGVQKLCVAPAPMGSGRDAGVTQPVASFAQGL